ncbi:MAG: nicotinic acid mononucleotide adenylyltransferase [Azospira oryzae]|nr:MAG: nicotinic acid mononucleotide adenylyltransferase [Azospira oryzae]PZP82570.1 MAG: nicotinic acid mononucleotide adenylyltransferase [Azospira oryzae]
MKNFRLIGVLGGTFDPVHYGHLRIAEEVAEALGLAEVRFVPAGHPPLRGAPAAAAEHRAQMVRLAIAGNPRFILERCEIERPGTSYTVDTLDTLRRAVGPQAALCLILGGDAAARLPAWSRWRRLLELAHLVLVRRPGSGEIPAPDWPAELARQWEERRLDAPLELAHNPAGRMICVATTALAISASSIRDLLRCGRSARYLLPDSVLDYIEVNRLYTPGGG